MAYAYLAAAILFEVLGTIAIKYTEGFTKVVPVILTVVCHGICFVALALALKSLPISVVYAVLAGVGTAAMAFVGLMIFNEPLHFQKVLAVSLIVIGVVWLNVSEKVTDKPQNLVEIKTEQVAPVSVEETPAHQGVFAQRNSG